MKKSLLMLTAAALLPIAATAQNPAPEFVAMTYHFDAYAGAKTIPDILKEIKDNPLANAAITGIAAYFGVDPSTVQATLEVGAKLVSQKGGDRTTDYTLPPSYRYCRSHMEIQSEIGNFYIGVTRFTRSVRVYTSVSQKGVSQGQSSVEGNITLMGVRDENYAAELTANHCTAAPDGKVLFENRHPSKGPGYKD